MKIIKSDSFNKVVGYKIGLLTYGKLTISRQNKTDYRIEINFGKANKHIPNYLWMLYKSPKKPKIRNLPFLHLLAIPQLIASTVYLVLFFVLNVIWVTCFFHIYDELCICPRSWTRLTYEFIWTGIALVLMLLFLLD